MKNMDTANMNAEQAAWTKKLEKLLMAMPEGIELLVGFDKIDVHQAGFYSREIYDEGVDMMMASTLIADASLKCIEVDGQRIRPNSETI